MTARDLFRSIEEYGVRVVDDPPRAGDLIRYKSGGTEVWFFLLTDTVPHGHWFVTAKSLTFGPKSGIQVGETYFEKKRKHLPGYRLIHRSKR